MCQVRSPAPYSSNLITLKHALADAFFVYDPNIFKESAQGYAGSRIESSGVITFDFILPVTSSLLPLWPLRTSTLR